MMLSVLVTSPDGSSAVVEVLVIGSFLLTSVDPLLLNLNAADGREVAVLLSTLAREHEQGCLFVEGRSGWTVEPASAGVAGIPA